jgi:hypothetical protein
MIAKRDFPRETAEKRPMKDTSKPADGIETGHALLCRTECVRDVEMSESPRVML